MSIVVDDGNRVKPGVRLTSACGDDVGPGTLYLEALVSTLLYDRKHMGTVKVDHTVYRFIRGRRCKIIYSTSTSWRSSRHLYWSRADVKMELGWRHPTHGMGEPNDGFVLCRCAR